MRQKCIRGQLASRSRRQGAVPEPAPASARSSSSSSSPSSMSSSSTSSSGTAPPPSGISPPLSKKASRARTRSPLALHAGSPGQQAAPAPDASPVRATPRPCSRACALAPPPRAPLDKELGDIRRRARSFYELLGHIGISHVETYVTVVTCPSVRLYPD